MTSDSGDAEAPKLSLKKRLAFLTILLAIALLLTELLLGLTMKEVVLRRTRAQGGIIVPFQPGGEGDHVTPEFRVRYQINAFGYRDKPREADKAAGVTRVALLGDSFSVGWGIPQDATYAALCEASLGGVELWNAARSGNNPAFYIAQARSMSARFEVDALLVQLFDNDIQEAADGRRSFEAAEGGRLGPLRERYAWSGSALAELETWLEQRALRRGWRKLRDLAEGKPFKHFVRAGAAFPTEAPVATDLAALVRGENPGFEAMQGWFHADQREAWKDRIEGEGALLRQLIDEAREREQPLALIYIPHPVVFAPEARALNWPEDNPHRQLVRAIAAEAEVPLLDLSEALLAHEAPLSLYYPGDLHLNPAGHAFLAEALLASPIPATWGARAPR